MKSLRITATSYTLKTCLDLRERKEWKICHKCKLKCKKTQKSDTIFFPIGVSVGEGSGILMNTFTKTRKAQQAIFFRDRRANQ